MIAVVRTRWVGLKSKGVVVYVRRELVLMIVVVVSPVRVIFRVMAKVMTVMLARVQWKKG